MNETATKLPPATLLEPVASKGELVPLGPTLDQLTAAIRAGHNEVVGATVHAVVKAVETGKDLIEAKKRVKKARGNFTEYVPLECRISMSTAQDYMKFARYEPEVRQMLADKAHGGGYLTYTQARKLINTLSRKNRRKKRPAST